MSHTVGLVKLFTLIDRSLEVASKLKKIMHEFIILEYYYHERLGYITHDISNEI